MSHKSSAFPARTGFRFIHNAQYSVGEQQEPDREFVNWFTVTFSSLFISLLLRLPLTALAASFSATAGVKVEDTEKVREEHAESGKKSTQKSFIKAAEQAAVERDLMRLIRLH